MTIQEYKSHLDNYMSILEDAGATADELYGARCQPDSDDYSDFEKCKKGRKRWLQQPVKGE